ncbi:MAG: endolytic transglycosylase MltG, partial [Actinomycetia bacterium]|nr:endolytic transglycosylase MltG [Actinomycetes bacterium]
MTDSAAATPTEERWKKPLLIAAAVVVAVVALVLVSRILASAVAGDQALNVESGIAVSVEIKAGSSAREIATAMEQAGVVRASELRAVVE